MIVINGIRWNLLLVSSSNPALQMPHGKQALGYCDNFTHIIYINRELPKRKIKEVLRHEITHAVIYSHNVSLTPREEEVQLKLLQSMEEK